MALKYRCVTKEELEKKKKKVLQRKRRSASEEKKEKEEKGNGKKRRRRRDRPQCTQSRRQIKEIRKNEPVTVMYHRPAGGLVRKALRKGKSRKTLTFE